MPLNNKIKILCLIGQLGNGGSEKQLYLFLKYLDRTKYEPFVVVSSAEHGIWSEIIKNDISCDIVSLGDKSAPLKKLAKFKLLERRLKPDLILSWSFYVNAYSIVTGGKKFIGCLRGELEAVANSLNPLHFRLSRYPRTLLANSSLLKKEIVEEGYPEDRVFIVNNMFEVNPDYACPEKLRSKRTEIRNNFGIKDDEILVVGAGRNAPEKDFSFFIETFWQALSVNPSLRGLLIGTGGLGVKKRIEELGISSKVIVTGEIPFAKDIFPCGDIFFLSSRYEGMPNVMLEALDARVSILSMDVGGVRDILGEDNPFFEKIVVKNRDASEAAKMLLGQAEDRDLRDKISDYNARSRLPCFSCDRLMGKYYQLFENVFNSFFNLKFQI